MRLWNRQQRHEPLHGTRATNARTHILIAPRPWLRLGGNARWNDPPINYSMNSIASLNCDSQVLPFPSRRSPLLPAIPRLLPSPSSGRVPETTDISPTFLEICLYGRAWDERLFKPMLVFKARCVNLSFAVFLVGPPPPVDVRMR